MLLILFRQPKNLAILSPKVFLRQDCLISVLKSLIIFLSLLGFTRAQDIDQEGQKHLFDFGVLLGMTYSPKGNMIASYGSAGVILWDAQNYTPVTLLESTATVHSAAFSPDGNILAVGGSNKDVELWDTVTGELKTTLRGSINGNRSFSFSANGKSLVGSSNDGTVRLWNIEQWTSSIP